MTTSVYPMIPCRRCGQDFEVRNGSQRQCRACLTRECAACGKVFNAASKKEDARYCSSACYLGDRWKGHRVVVACARCGKQKEMRKAAATTYCDNRCAGKTISADPAWRANLSSKLKGHPSFTSAARTAQLNAARTKRAWPPSEETRAKIRAKRLLQRFPSTMTGIEQALFDELRRRRLTFEMHRTMFGRWQPDFVFAQVRLVVQADGDYWHGRPAARANDAKFNAAAAEAGWTVIRFSGTQIKADAAACAKMVAKFVRAHHANPSASSRLPAPAM